MGNSTVKLQYIVNAVASMPDINPQANPGDYGTDTLLAAANDAMSDLIARRFNFKWNSAQAAPFLTNSWQQDYPIAGLRNVGWIEESYWVDINNTARPIPMGPIEPRRDLPVQGGRWCSKPAEIAWQFNMQMQLGTWPGPGVLFSPLLTKGVVAQNPSLNMLDTNGNILIVVQMGTTGKIAPAAQRGAVEGMTVQDGSVLWMVVSPTSQGFRLAPLPPGAGPVYQVHVKYQMEAVPFTDLNQTLGVIPDGYSHHFRELFRIACQKYSPDPRVRSQYEPLRGARLAEIGAAETQGDREADAYRLLPATSVIEPRLGYLRDPRDPSRPY